MVRISPPCKKIYLKDNKGGKLTFCLKLCSPTPAIKITANLGVVPTTTIEPFCTIQQSDSNVSNHIPHLNLHAVTIAVRS